MNRLTVASSRPQELIDITSAVRDAVRGWTADAILVYVPHTTAGVLINEHADPAVATDLLAALDRIVPDDGMYRHAEGNSAAHVRATITGTSQLVPLVDGDLALGTWQGIFFAEFDGPRQRTVWLSPLGGQ